MMLKEASIVFHVHNTVSLRAEPDLNLHKPSCLVCCEDKMSHRLR